MKPRLAATALVAASACALALGACTPGDTAQSSSSPAAKGGGDGNYTIAVVPKDATNPWFVRMETGVKKYAEDTGMNAFQKGPAETDATMQAQVIQDLIAQGVDAICVVPVDPGAIEPVLKQAMDAGIVVVTHEGASQQNTMYDIEAFNNSEYGAFIMDNLAQAMGEEGVYTTMVGHVTNASHNEWADGAVAHQKEKYPKMTLLEAEPRVESQDNGETAYQTAKEVLKKYPEVKGILGTSSFDAPGTARAIEELGLKGKVFTAGTGMPAANAQILKDGSVHTLTLWDPADAGYAMASLATKILNGEKIEDGVNLGVKGYESMHFSRRLHQGPRRQRLDPDHQGQRRLPRLLTDSPHTTTRAPRPRPNERGRGPGSAPRVGKDTTWTPQCWRYDTSANPSQACEPWSTSTSTSRPEKSTASPEKTGRANPPSSKSSPESTPPNRVRSPSGAATSRD